MRLKSIEILRKDAYCFYEFDELAFGPKLILGMNGKDHPPEVDVIFYGEVIQGLISQSLSL
jgi:hypothetical protein